MSRDRNAKLRKHLEAIGQLRHGGLTKMLDRLVDEYLASPVKALREQAYADRMKSQSEAFTLRAEVRELRQRLPKS